MEKNRFSTLLEELVATSEVKHSLLAQELQFDVSYISKWISGRVLPSEKTADDTIQKISKCLAHNASEAGLGQLCQNYNVASREELADAAYENLIAEYYYVKESRRSSDHMIANKVSYYPWLSIENLLRKMNHPILRRVKSLNIMAAMDLFSIENEYRPKVVSLGYDSRASLYEYPDVHFSLLINLQKMEQDIVRNTLFISNILRALSLVDFRFYRSDFAFGKIVFVERDELAVSGILVRPDSCASVTVCEGSENSRPLYNSMQSLCTREAMLFLRMDMQRVVLDSMDYLRSLLAPGRSWMLGHVTEHLMPEPLFREMTKKSRLYKEGCPMEALCHLRKVAEGILCSPTLRVTISEAAISRFVISGRVDFFCETMVLNFNQRIQALQHILEILHRTEAAVKIIQSPLVSDFEYDFTPSIFLSGTLSFLRLEALHGGVNQLLKINRKEMQTLYHHFMEELWRQEEHVVSDVSVLERFIHQQIQGLQLLADTVGDEEKEV